MGSSRAYRRTRAEVLLRDGMRCRFADALAGRYRASALGAWARTLVVSPDCTGGDAALLQAHHVRGLDAGDDPAWLLTGCRACNLATGNPRGRDARPARVSRW